MLWCAGGGNHQILSGKNEETSRQSHRSTGVSLGPDIQGFMFYIQHTVYCYFKFESILYHIIYIILTAMVTVEIALTYCNTKGIQYTFTMATTNLRSNLSTYRRAFQLWPVLRGLTQVKPSRPARAREGSERQSVCPEDRRQVPPSEEHFGRDQLLQRSRQAGPLVSSPSTL